jgi:cytochrome P450
MSTSEMVEIDLLDPSLYIHGFPHEIFTDLRRQGPVLKHRAAKVGDRGMSEEFWVLLTHPVVQKANRDWETFSAAEGPSVLPTPRDGVNNTLVASDPPEHDRLRRLISSGFTPRMVRKLDDQILHYTNVILDEVIARDGNVDFVRDVAYRLPMEMIADIMGIPVPDRPRIFGVIDVMFTASDPQNDLTPDDNLAATMELYEYAQALGDAKRRDPQDDVWSKIALAEIEHENGEVGRLSTPELDAFFIILSIAGSETTRNALSSGLTAFVENPGEYQRLCDEPEVLDTATDEIIRWASPVTMFARQATRDVELGGAQIAEGERITMWYPSANRDDSVFEQPFRFDIGRTPNPHVSFGGGGVHYCLGSNLAKLEVRTMFEQIARRFSKIEITGPAEFCCPGDVIATTANHLPVRMTPR